MKSQILGVSALLFAAKEVIAADYLISDRYHLSKRQERSTKNITFAHINDVHAHLDEYRSSGVDCPRNTTENMNVTKVPCFGGAARLIQAINDIRDEDNTTVVLNAGDEFQGTLFYSYYGGEVIGEVMNQIGYDAFTLGNHEFDGGEEPLAQFLQNITAPAVSTNIKSSILGPYLSPFLLFPQHEMALVALTTTTVPGISSPAQNTTFEDYSVVQTVADSLLQSRLGFGNGQIKRVVALTHIGYEEDIKLAQNSRNIYLIIGGHSHTRLGNDTAAIGPYPTIVKNLDGEDVFVVTSWRWGQQLGHIQVEYEETTGKILAYTGAPINMTEAQPQNATMQQEILGFRAPFDEFSRQVIGTTATDLDQTTCQQMECTLGNAVTDSMVFARTQVGANIDFAIHNAGGIRATIDAPDVTRGEVLTSFPFGNQLVDVSFTGQELWSIFEGVVSDVNSVGQTITSFIQVSSGCKFSYNPNNPVGSRLISLNIGGADVDFARTYNLVTLDFIQTGGDFIFPNAPTVPGATLGSQSDVFEAWVIANTPLNVQVEGRIVVTTETVPQHTLTA